MAYLTVKSERVYKSLDFYEPDSRGGWTKEKIIEAGKSSLFIDKLIEYFGDDTLSENELDDILDDSDFCFGLVGLNKNGEGERMRSKS